MDLKVHVQMSQVCSPVQGRTPTSPPPQHSHMNSDSVKPLYTSSRCPPFFPPGGPGPIHTPPPSNPHQQALINLHIAVQVSQVCGLVQGHHPPFLRPFPSCWFSTCPCRFTPPPSARAPNASPAGTHRSPHSRPGAPGVQPCAGVSQLPIIQPIGSRSYSWPTTHSSASTSSLHLHFCLAIAHTPSLLPPNPTPLKTLNTTHQQVLVGLSVPIQVCRECCPVQGHQPHASKLMIPGRTHGVLLHSTQLQAAERGVGALHLS